MSSILNPTPGGGSGNSDDIVTVPFAYTTSSPMLLQAVTAGQIVNRAVVVITVPFNGVGASVYLGTTTTPQLILGASDVDVAVDDQYGNDSLFEFLVNDYLNLTINPSGSTQGEGLLFYRIK